MALFYEQNPELRYHFENLPIEIKNKIIESGVEVRTLDELNRIAQRIKESNR